MDKDMDNKWRYEVRLQNGEVLMDSGENNEFFEDECDAERAGWDAAYDWLDSQDCDDDDKFMEGDLRVYGLKEGGEAE